MQILFNTISDLTGGLISDITTVLIALLALSFILMGIEYLWDILSGSFEEMKVRKQGLSVGMSADDIDSHIASSREDARRELYAENLKKYGRRGL